MLFKRSLLAVSAIAASAAAESENVVENAAANAEAADAAFGV